MKFSDRLAALDRLQQARVFKIIASCIVVGLCLAGFIAYSVAAAANASGSIITPESLAPPPEAAPAPAADGKAPDAAKPPTPQLDVTAKIVNDILRTKQSTAGVGVGLSIFAALSLLVIWLGLGLTYLALAILGAVLVGICVLLGRGRDLGVAAGGLVGLVAAFASLMQALRLLFSGSGAVMAIARLVLAEAVRMKVSIIFMVLVVFGLTALPLMLDPAQPLRYRVQSFLQFSTAGSFWLIAILVLVFSVSTITLEQRDKIVWQTMTKPVQAWQYILGKWLGVSGLAAALLLVCASGVFMFTEFLRSQPALGENQAYVAKAGQGITEDRLVLETQVLTARRSVLPVAPKLDEEQFKKNVDERARAEIATLEQSISDPDQLKAMRTDVASKIAESLRKAVFMEYRAIAPGGNRVFEFRGLDNARDSNRPIILRFKFDSGSNRPDAEFKVTLGFAGGNYQVVPIGLGQFQSIPISPALIDANGNLQLEIINGDAERRIANPEAISFAPDGLEVSYSASGFRANFFRCIAVLWVKLAFLAMLAICASTFLSFPVACLVAFAAFLAAEGAGFISGALENYSTEDRDGKMLLLPTVVSKIAAAVSGTFGIYADLRPTARIVEGLELSWTEITGGIVVLAAATAFLFAIASYIFRRRELATYSGQ